MKITLLKYIFNYIRILINWFWKIIKKCWDLIIHVPPNLLTIISIVFLIYALTLSIQNRNDSSRFQKSVEENLRKITQLSDSLRNNLNALPKSIETFGTSIKGLNSVIEEQQIALNKSIGYLNGSVDEFSKSLISYRTSLSKIIEATDKQVELLKKTQARWEEEISRKPVLLLRADSARVIASDTLFVNFSLVNIGNQTAKVQALALDIPTSYKLISDNWIPSGSVGGIQQYSYTPTQTLTLTYSPESTSAPSRTGNRFRFRLIKPINSKFPLSISYVIFEENTGIQTGELKLPLSESNAR